MEARDWTNKQRGDEKDDEKCEKHESVGRGKHRSHKHNPLASACMQHVQPSHHCCCQSYMLLLIVPLLLRGAKTTELGAGSPAAAA